MFLRLPQLALWLVVTAGPGGGPSPLPLSLWTEALVRQPNGLAPGWWATAPNPTSFEERCAWLRRTPPETQMGFYCWGSPPKEEDLPPGGLDREPDDIWLHTFFATPGVPGGRDLMGK